MGGGGSEGEVFQSQDDENISANFPVKFSSSRLTDREKYLLKKCWHLKKELLPNSRKSQLHLDRRTTSRWMVGPFSWCRRFNDYHSLLLPIPQLNDDQRVDFSTIENSRRIAR